MGYQEYKPSQNLSMYIDSYWISKASNETATSRILPDGFVDLIFDLNSIQPLNDRARVSGMMTVFRDVTHNRDAEMIGVRIKPSCFNLISKVPLSEIKNGTGGIKDFVPKFDGGLINQLIEPVKDSIKLKTLEEELRRLIVNSTSKLDSLVLSVVDNIEQSFQSVDFVRLSNQHAISLRQLERRFKLAVGVTMKEYQSIVRFCNVHNSIQQSKDDNLLSAAYQHGYYDHAHLTKEFTKMAGKNPSTF